MKDIAAELGVSIVTVSSALRNRGRISPAVRARIIKRARELNYRPDLTARALATGRTSQIGMIVPDLMHPFFAAIAKYMSRALREKGYTLVISSSEDDPHLEMEEVHALLARRVDALVLASSHSTSSNAIFRHIADAKVPLVLLDRPVDGIGVPFIGSDNEAIGELATEHLIGRGYRRIAYIGVSALSTGSGRLRGYKAVLRRHRLPVDPALIQMVESADERGEQCGHAAMQILLQQRPHLDAAFCLNDIIAAGAFRAVVEVGLAIPGDVAIIGVSNLPGLSFWHSTQASITSVDQNVMGIATKAAEAVLQLLGAVPGAAPRRSCIALTLVHRSST